MDVKQTDKPRISLIVPIYNVEKYIRECLESLKNQTIKEIEIICIDDGSTDNSGRIADEYKTDPRFRVIHTENRGLSTARNRGIDEAKADWLMFVDSDDRVDNDFCRIPYESVIKTGSDLVIFGRFLTSESGRVKYEKKRSIATGIIDHETAIEIGWPAVWNKLYKKSLFDDIHFPENTVYEELLTTHKLVYKAQKIVSTPEKLYYYRLRKDGITSNRANDEAWLESSIKRAEELEINGYPSGKAREQLWSVALKCYGRANNINNPVYIKASGILQRIKKVPTSFSKKERIMMAVYLLNKNLFRCIYRTLKR